MRSAIFIFIIIITTILSHAQSNRIKTGFIGIPLFQSGFGMITLGYERLNNKKNKSWQITGNASLGSIAADATSINRKWVTIERINYIKNKKEKQKFFYSFFIEAGSRNKLPGYVHSPPDSILNKTTSFEINPGVGAGIHFRIKKKFGLRVFAGPKIIFAKTKDQYYNSITRNSYSAKYNETRPGFGYTGTLSYQF